VEKKKYTFIELSKATSIPVPRTLTSEEEAEILQAYSEYLGPVKSEAEYLELFRQAELGQLVSVEDLLEELERDELERKK
jgi:hypothetical protein